MKPQKDDLYNQVEHLMMFYPKVRGNYPALYVQYALNYAGVGLTERQQRKLIKMPGPESISRRMREVYATHPEWRPNEDYEDEPKRQTRGKQERLGGFL